MFNTIYVLWHQKGIYTSYKLYIKIFVLAV